MNKVIVTGSSGFIGSALVKRIIESGDQVIAPTHRNNSLVHPSVKLVDSSNVEEMALQFNGAKTCFHLATFFSGNPRSTELDAIVDGNLGIALRVGRACQLSEVETVVYAESAAQHIDGLYNNPSNVYASLKQASASVLEVLGKDNFKLLKLTLFDTYGENDHRQKLLKLLMDSRASNETLNMSPGDQLVDYLYVEDVVSGLIHAAELCSSSESHLLHYRLSNPTKVTLRSFVNLIENILDIKFDISWGTFPYRQGEMFRDWLFPLDLPGWTPKFTLESGLERALKKT